ncbi:MAG: hypothetical protein CL780_00425 [Chloroflexi bacterium]|nr:hypothetical protein [Chloroflexota bacterium]
MEGNITLFKILGIPIKITLTWILAFILITCWFSVGIYPARVEGFTVINYWVIGAITSLSLFISVLIHELAHSFVALSKGHSIEGITLFLFGGVSKIIGESKSASDEFYISFSGPFSSLLIGVLLIFIDSYLNLGNGLISTNISLLITSIWFMNISLAVFNLIPGFPMDGGRILRSIIWGITGNKDKSFRIAYTVGKYIAFLIIAWGVLTIIRGSYFGLWTILVGFFLYSSGRNEYMMNRVKNASNGNIFFNFGTQTKKSQQAYIPISMATKPLSVSIDANMEINELRSMGYLNSYKDVVSVISEGKIEGFIGLRDLEQMDIDQKMVSDVIKTRLFFSIQKDESCEMALKIMDQNELFALLVLDGNENFGSVIREDILDVYN